MVGSGMIGCQANGKRCPRKSSDALARTGPLLAQEQPKAVPAAAPALAPKSDPCNPVIGPDMMTTKQGFPTGDMASSHVMQEVFPRW